MTSLETCGVDPKKYRIGKDIKTFTELRDHGNLCGVEIKFCDGTRFMTDMSTNSDCCENAFVRFDGFRPMNGDSYLKSITLHAKKPDLIQLDDTEGSYHVVQFEYENGRRTDENSKSSDSERSGDVYIDEHDDHDERSDESDDGYEYDDGSQYAYLTFVNEHNGYYSHFIHTEMTNKVVASCSV